jgi:hypothetical protein
MKLAYVSLLASLLCSLPALAQELLRPGECEALYREKAHKEMVRREKAGEIGSQLYITGGIVGMMTGQLPITLVTMFTGLPMALWSHTDGTHTKNMALLDEESKRMKKFLKRAHREISPYITAEEVTDMLLENLDNGFLCQSRPKLWSHHMIRDFLYSELAKKYAAN